MRSSRATVSYIGYTHIDVAFYWMVSQTREKVQRSFSTVLALMRRYPEYIFTASQPQLYKFAKEEMLELYEEIKQRLREGRWEVEGGMWLEATVTSSVAKAWCGSFCRASSSYGMNLAWIAGCFGCRMCLAITVVDRDSPGNLRLRYYFDIADTHESQRSRPVPAWEMNSEYEADVIETLENTFGQLKEKESLPEAIYAAADNAVADNITDYLSDLIDCREGSFLEDLDALNIAITYRNALTISVAAMMMTWCGIDLGAQGVGIDFSAVHNFNIAQIR